MDIIWKTILASIVDCIVILAEAHHNATIALGDYTGMAVLVKIAKWLIVNHAQTNKIVIYVIMDLFGMALYA